MSLKEDADAADSSLISCLGDEKSKLEAVVAAEVALAAAEQSVILPYQQQVDRTHFDFRPATDFKFFLRFRDFWPLHHSVGQLLGPGE